MLLTGLLLVCLAVHAESYGARNVRGSTVRLQSFADLDGSSRDARDGRLAATDGRTIGAFAVGILGGVLLTSLAWFAYRWFSGAAKENTSEEKETAEELPPGPVQADDPPSPPEKPQKQDGKELEAVFKALAEEAMPVLVRRFVPLMTRTQALRSMAEHRAALFAANARVFLMNELNGAAGDVCKVLDTPEAMVLEELKNIVSMRLPASNVVLTGLTTPLLLQVRVVVHVAQILLVLLPLGALCAWALIVDFAAACDPIPSIKLWLWVQAMAVYVMILARAVLVVKVQKGQAELRQKSEKVKEELAEARQLAGAGGLQLGELRRLIAAQVSLLQHAVLVEENIRFSLARHLVGLGSLTWVVTTFWTYVLMFGWSTMPGTVHYEPSSLHDHAWCGARVTVLTLRICALVATLVFLLNLAGVILWLFDVTMRYSRASKVLLDQAEQFDNNSIGGLPVAQLMVKTLLLQSPANIVAMKLAAAVDEESTINKEITATEEKLASLKKSLAEKQTQLEELQQETNKLSEHSATQPDAAEAPPVAGMDAWLESWRRAGEEAIEAALEKSRAQGDVTATEDLDRLLVRFREGVEQVRQSDAFQAAVNSEMAQSASEAMPTEGALRSMLVQLRDAAETGLAQAQQAAEGRLADAQRAAQDGLSQAQQAAEAGLAQAQQAAGSAAGAAASQSQGVFARVQQAARAVTRGGSSSSTQDEQRR